MQIVKPVEIKCNLFERIKKIITGIAKIVKMSTLLFQDLNSITAKKINSIGVHLVISYLK